MADIRSIAFHESGHCIAGLALNCVIHRIAIAPYSRLHRLGELEVVFAKNKVSAASQTVTVCLAGGIAQRVACPGSKAGDDVDLRLAIDAATYLASNPRRYLERSRREAAKLIDRHWRAVEAVAAALLERGRLSGQEIAALVL